MGHLPGLFQWTLLWSNFCFFFKSLMVSNAQLIYFTHKVNICFYPNASTNLSLILTVATCSLSCRWRCLLLQNSGSRVTWRGQCWSSSPLWDRAWNEGVGGVGGAERKGIRMKSSHGSCRDVLPIMRCSESERAVTKAQSNRLLPNSPFSLAVIGNAWK